MVVHIPSMSYALLEVILENRRAELVRDMDIIIAGREKDYVDLHSLPGKTSGHFLFVPMQISRSEAAKLFAEWGTPTSFTNN